MEFTFSPELTEYIKKKNSAAIAVTIADTSCSDLNVEELHIRLLDQRSADFMKQKKGYHGYPSEVCEVLLPNYRLDYTWPVHFYIKKVWVFTVIKSRGIAF